MMHVINFFVILQLEFFWVLTESKLDLALTVNDESLNIQ